LPVEANAPAITATAMMAANDPTTTIARRRRLSVRLRRLETRGSEERMVLTGIAIFAAPGCRHKDDQLRRDRQLVTLSAGGSAGPRRAPMGRHVEPAVRNVVTVARELDGDRTAEPGRRPRDASGTDQGVDFHELQDLVEPVVPQEPSDQWVRM
jgi:hypothetical protein